MIEKINIQNFKSIYDLEIKTSRVNLFIGENGSGKSNLLEALAFISANQSNKLDNEFLVSRGIRVTKSNLMRSAFNDENQNNTINISISDKDNNDSCSFINEDTEYSKWMYKSKNKIIESLKKIFPHKTDEDIKYLELEFIDMLNDSKEDFLSLLDKKNKHQVIFKHFLIYSPENTSLRIFEKEGQIQPLGINGEGLLKLLKVVNNYEDKSYIETIIKSLHLFNWFENITIPNSIELNGNRVIIKDKYLNQEFDQRSANEGFLFILFYITLIVAKETPKVFAIDNIDASLNPKLCTKLMTILINLAKKYDKQIFLTTHNPAILDGIDLNDDEQKLFVVSRNKKGHTRMKNIIAKDNPISDDGESLHLSEAFLRGYLGGLPKGF